MAASDYSLTAALAPPLTLGIATARNAASRYVAGSCAALYRCVFRRELMPFRAMGARRFALPVGKLAEGRDALFDRGRLYVQRLGHAPSAVTQSALQHKVVDAELLGCVGEGVAHALKRDAMIGALVAVLSLASDPRAVIRAVALIVVDPLNSHAWRALAHVGQEVREGVAPPVAHSDSAGAIVRKRFAVRVLTPINHSHEHRVERVLGSAVSRAS